MNYGDNVHWKVRVHCVQNPFGLVDVSISHQDGGEILLARNVTWPAAHAAVSLFEGAHEMLMGLQRKEA